MRRQQHKHCSGRGRARGPCAIPLSCSLEQDTQSLLSSASKQAPPLACTGHCCVERDDPRRQPRLGVVAVEETQVGRLVVSQAGCTEWDGVQEGVWKSTIASKRCGQRAKEKRRACCARSLYSSPMALAQVSGGPKDRGSAPQVKFRVPFTAAGCECSVSEATRGGGYTPLPDTYTLAERGTGLQGA